MVYSASSTRTLLEGSGDGTGYLVKYLAYGAVGIGCMQLLARRGLQIVRNVTPLLLAGAFVLLVLVLVPGLGVEINGAQRWLGFGPLQFQPSEIMKLALVLHVAAVISTRPEIARSLKGVLGPVIGVTGAAVLLIFAQPDLGTSLVACFTIGAMLVVAGVPVRQLALVAGTGALIVLVFALIEPYRRARLTAFMNPWADAGDTGFQAVQGQIAIASGGLFGLGPGQSVQKAFYLPEAHTDFILAVIGEELGVVGVCCLLLLYGMIAYAGLRTAKAAKGAYAKLVAAGITSLILCQALLNVYAVLGLAPLTGVPLPFISSGSSSLLVLLTSMGLVLNVAGGGRSVVRAVPASDRDGSQSGDRGRRDSGPRRAGAGGGRRVAS